MKWIKKGLVYAPDGSLEWAQKHAFPATPYFIKEDVIRLYVAFCDGNTVGRVGYVDVAAGNPSKVLNVSSKPVLDIGSPGAFDENGVVPTCLVKVGSRLYLYYVGFQLGMKVRYYQFEGLAISGDGGETFVRHSKVPIIDRSDRELVNRTSAFVMYDEDVFKMWYTAGSKWLVVNDKPLPIYNLHYLESKDGMTWGKAGQLSVDFKNEDEHALGRPWVIKKDGGYTMFYSIRTKSSGYKLGYAESKDGIEWQRKDEEIGIEVSAEGWDSKMIGYASIVEYKDNVYMFYNGNDCGQTGFGYALLDKE